MIALKRCFFLGNRDTDGGGVEAVQKSILHAFCLGANEFYVGGYGRFDDTAYEAVSHLKNIYSCIRLYQVLAYHPATIQITLRPGFDGSFYPLDTPPPPQYAIARVNRRMIEYCDILITCIRHPGYSSRLMDFARHREQKGQLFILALP